MNPTLRSLVVGLALLAVLASTALAACPTNCEQHGRCSGDTCICNTNYEGTDCSIYNKVVTSGEVASDSVDRAQWKYYNIYNARTAEMVFWLNNSAGTDCDLYVQLNTFPDRATYLARNISTLPNVSIRLDSARIGTYYAGVFGYTACQYAFSATIVGSCPDNCNGHGSCVQSTCRCYTGYSGDACELSMTTVTAGTRYNGNVAQGVWDYFLYTPRELLNGINYVLEIATSTSHADCDMYVKMGGQPSLWDWDLRNVSTASVLTLNQTAVVEGSNYYIGVYGYFGCAYTFHLETVVPETPKDCPNQCSLHNTNCFHGSCVCSPGYSGSECETRDTELVLYNPVSGYAGKNAWNYYHIHSRSANSLVINVEIVDSGDCDLYVKGSHNPTRFDFDYVDISTQSKFNVTIVDPGDIVWYIGLYGWSECTYVLNVTESSQCDCAPYPSGHGSCQPHSTTCVCNAGWVGDRCDQQVVHLQSKDMRRGDSVRKGQWNYYVMSATSSSEFALSLKETNTTGFVWVFVSHSEYPTLAIYDYSDKASHKAIHEISYVTKQPQSGDLYIGVYGSPYMPDQAAGKVFTASYDMAVYMSDF